jgi:hypothetical protein
MSFWFWIWEIVAGGIFMLGVYGFLLLVVLR